MAANVGCSSRRVKRRGRAGTRALKNARAQESIGRNREAAGIRRSASIKQTGNERRSA
jgi:hypothetical protein